MQKILFVKDSHLEEVNSYLTEGWHVVSIVPCFEAVASGSDWVGGVHGDYGAYVVVSNEDK